MTLHSNNIDLDYPLLDVDSEAAYWRKEANRAAVKLDAGLCINPVCARSLRATGFTCGADACITYVCDDLTAASFWLHLYAQIGRTPALEELGWRHWFAVLALVALPSAALTTALFAAARRFAPGLLAG